ncbi:hypothetical protein [Polaromonas sp. CG9_12]|nr:hypothetical protein [Polaromonas sp. CG9_12]
MFIRVLTGKNGQVRGFHRELPAMATDTGRLGAQPQDDQFA